MTSQETSGAAKYPKCSVCGKPMVAGQRGSHLSCAPGYLPWRPLWTLNPSVTADTPRRQEGKTVCVACEVCGHTIKAVHNITIHYDCLSGRAS